VLIALCAGVLAGAMNGVLVAWFKIEPVIATLVLMVSGRGIAKYIAGEQVISVPRDEAFAAFDWIGNGHLFGLPFPTLLALSLALATFVIVRRSSVGLLIESVGGNAIASRATGINDRMVKMFVYVFAALCAGIGGLVDTAYINASDPVNAGVFTELDAIFAVLVGGTALTGGRFSLAGSVSGAILLQTMLTTMYAYGVPSDIAPVPKAAVIIAVCLLQSARVQAWFARRKQFSASNESTAVEPSSEGIR
jgi:simple sugar transport system permease protein